MEVSKLLIPSDCKEGFLAAFWKRPEAYLNNSVRQSMSVFAKMKDRSIGLQKLREDLESGRWAAKNKEILNNTSLDAGYVIFSVRV